MGGSYRHNAEISLTREGHGACQAELLRVDPLGCIPAIQVPPGMYAMLPENIHWHVLSRGFAEEQPPFTVPGCPG